MSWGCPQGSERRTSPLGEPVTVSKPTVLVVEDDGDIRRLLKTYLSKDGYHVLEAQDGRAGLELARDESPDIVLLDLMLPIMDGLEVCRELRRTSTVPIIMITARDDDFDKVLGLEVGADDYVTKPFNPREIVARVKATFRRIRFEQVEQEKTLLRHGPLEVDRKARKATLKGETLQLTPLEFTLLLLLAQNPGEAFPRQRLLDQVWGYDYVGESRTVDTHVSALRVKFQKIDPSFKPIHAVWGIGYRFEW